MPTENEGQGSGAGAAGADAGKAAAGAAAAVGAAGAAAGDAGKAGALTGDGQGAAAGAGKAANGAAAGKAAEGGDAGAQGGADAGKKAADWRALPDDFPDRDDITKFMGQFTTQQDAMKAHWNAHRTVSRSIQPLGKNPSAEDITRFRRQNNVPETPEGYHDLLRIEPPTGVDLESDASKALIGEVLKAAHAAHTPPQYVRAQIAAAMQWAKAEGDRTQARMEDLALDADEKLRSEWRGDYEANVNIGKNWARAVINKVPEFKFILQNAVIDGMKAEDHPIMRKVAATLGRQMGEGQLASMAMTAGDADKGKEDLEALTAAYFAAKDAGDTAKAAALEKQRQELTRRLHGSGERA